MQLLREEVQTAEARESTLSRDTFETERIRAEMPRLRCRPQCLQEGGAHGGGARLQDANLQHMRQKVLNHSQAGRSPEDEAFKRAELHMRLLRERVLLQNRLAEAYCEAYKGHELQMRRVRDGLRVGAGAQAAHQAA